MTLKPAIAFDAVTKRFGAATRNAVDGVSLAIDAGEFLAVVGPSGSGKSTLLRLVNRLLDPDTGRVCIEGTDSRDLDPVGLRRRIGYVFQSGGLFPHLTVSENITVTPSLMGIEARDLTARADRLLTLVRLDPQHYRDRYPSELSGGERQRVGIARALAAGPAMVLLDEPFSALDPVTREGLGDDYRRLHGELGLTTVMITHDMTEAMLLADRIAVMREGRLVALGSAADLQRSDDPHVAAMLRASARQAAELSRRLAGTTRP